MMTCFNNCCLHRNNNRTNRTNITNGIRNVQVTNLPLAQPVPIPLAQPAPLLFSNSLVSDVAGDLALFHSTAEQIEINLNRSLSEPYRVGEVINNGFGFGS